MTLPPGLSTPVIVVGGIAPGLAVARSLGGRGIPVVLAEHGTNDFAGASRYVRARLAVPDPVRFESQFVQALHLQADRWGGSLLVPCTDEALVAVARAKRSLQRNYIVGSPAWDTIERVIEKRHTYEAAASIGVPAPRTVRPRSLADAISFAEQADYPCLVKPDQSHIFTARFGTKMFSASDGEELISMYRRAVDAGITVLLQEFIPGDDDEGCYLSSYRSGSRMLASFTVAKIRNAPPYYGSPRVVVSRHIPELEGPTNLLLDSVGLEGFSCTEYKRDRRDGTYKLMEVNARHNLSAMLAIRCGVDFPWIQYRHLTLGEEPEPSAFKSGVYWIDLPRDVKSTIQYLGREPMSPLAFLRPYARPHVFAVASRHDPGPEFRRISTLIFAAIRGVVRRLQVSEPFDASRDSRA
jgi:D-aspartate ligase